MPPRDTGARADLAFLLRWLLLGASAGGVAGFAVVGASGWQLLDELRAVL